MSAVSWVIFVTEVCKLFAAVSARMKWAGSVARLSSSSATR